MTEFEQQVAEVLKDLGVPDVNRVARRVAAAIKAGADAGISAFYGSWERSRAIPIRPLTDGLKASEPAALAALRGKP